MLRCRLAITLTIWLFATIHVSKSEEDALRIGAFNIQVFGQKKSKNPEVMNVLVKIIRRYDLLLIQEIRDSKQTAIKKLLANVNEGQPTTKQFKMVVSSRLGRTVSKEQYAYLYRPERGLTITETLEFEDGNEALNPADKYEDLFEREPYLIKVSSPKTVPKEFVIIGIHVAPEEAVHEITELEDAFDYARKHMHVNDVVAMGDLNADCTYVRKSEWKLIPLRSDPKYNWMIGDNDDTTVKKTHCAYDRFIFTKTSWSEGIKPGSAVVYNYDEDPKIMKKMPQELAIKVSDHYPIEFQLLIRNAKISIKEVYIDLKINEDLKPNLCTSLLQNKVYFLYRTEVFDMNGVFVGSLRQTNQEKLISALLDIENLISDPMAMEVRRQRRRYKCRQKIIISIDAGMDHTDEVKDILTSKGVKFE